MTSMATGILKEIGGSDEALLYLPKRKTSGVMDCLFGGAWEAVDGAFDALKPA